MKIDITNDTELTVFKLSGRLDVESSQKLKDMFEQQIEKDKKFIFDLEKIEFVDSTGLGSLVSCLKKITLLSGKLILIKIQPKPRMVFEITNAFKVFDIYDSFEEAKKSL